MTRTFIALGLDESLQRYLKGIMRRMAQALPSLSWVDAAGIHLTLAFLGELSDQQVSEAFYATELAARTVPPFNYCIAHPGIFGPPDHPRVIWIGVDEPSGKLLQLQRRLKQELAQRDFAIDTLPQSRRTAALAAPAYRKRPPATFAHLSRAPDQRDEKRNIAYRRKIYMFT